MGRGRNKKPDDQNGFGAWGGYMEAKKTKLNDQFQTVTMQQIEKESDIFKGIAIFVNGLTVPSAEKLKEIMAAHGGIYHTYQSSKTTHIIASNLPNVKIKQLGSVPIVKPSWITDSIALGKLQDHRRFLLYTNQSVTQPRLDFPTLGPEKPAIKTASDPNFLAEFYNNSRLHLISTLGAEFKQLIGQLRDTSTGIFVGREKLAQISRPNSGATPQNPTTVTIMHIDMDCFFVSVGLRNRPELRGHPVAVTHARSGQIAQSRDREAEFALHMERLPLAGANARIMHLDNNSSMSEIASCSYEARKYGIKNGMFLGTATKLCPELKTIPYDFEDYKQVSFTLYNTIASYTLDIEAVSCDEMYVDITSILHECQMNVSEFANYIRNEIITITGCPCSAGFGSNRLQARLATKRAKPCGQFHLTSNVDEYFSDISLSQLPGVGSATLVKLHNLGLNTCGDVQLAAIDVLKRELGPKIGETIGDMARGIDRKPLNYSHERKSVSAEINYGIRFKTSEECYNFLKKLSVEVAGRLAETRMRAKCLTLKLMVRAPEAPMESAKFLGHGVCDNISKSITPNTMILHDPEQIYKETKCLYDKLNVDYIDLRGVGVQLSKLEKLPQINRALSAFLKQPPAVGKCERENIQQDDTVQNNNKIMEPTKCSVNKMKTIGKSVDHYFKVKRENGVSHKKMDMKMENIDINVLNELPDDIRQEIIDAYQLDGVETKKHDDNSVECATKQSRFKLLNLPQLKQLLSEWMENEVKPVDVDVAMLGEHFKEMAIERKIEDLQVIFNFLFRKCSKLDRNWHCAYLELVNAMQSGMVARYGATLMVNRNLD